MARLFNYNNIPQTFLRLKGIKYRNIREVISSFRIYIIKDLINKHIKNKKEPQLFILNAEKYKTIDNNMSYKKRRALKN